MTYYVAGLTPSQVAEIVGEMVPNSTFPVRIADHQVHVSRTVTDQHWCKPLGRVEGPYDRAVRKLCQRVAGDRLLVGSGTVRAAAVPLLLPGHPWLFEDHQGDLLVHARLPTWGYWTMTSPRAASSRRQ